MKPIILNKNYRIEKDTYSWTLLFSEPRIRIDKKTQEEIEYIYEDKWYYPDIKYVLKKWQDLECKECSSIDELYEKLEIISNKISELKNTIFK